MFEFFTGLVAGGILGITLMCAIQLSREDSE